METLKYRVWSKKDKVYIKDTLIDQDGKVWKNTSENGLSLLPNCVLERGSSKQDFYGEEIYEGDKVYDSEKDDYGYVFYNEGMAQFMVIFNQDETCMYEVSNWLEIVGNIHTNEKKERKKRTKCPDFFGGESGMIFPDLPEIHTVFDVEKPKKRKR